MTTHQPNIAARSAHPAPLPSVAVLLSTYNGAAFLGEQLASLARQQGVEVLLHARDDGSCDETLAVLRSHGKRWTNLAAVAAGPNLGVARSFLELLQTAPDADYFAFCDQDDVWLDDKLARAIAALQGESTPALYCSAVTCVDGDLGELGSSPHHDDLSFAFLLFTNVATGCTILLNRAARALLITHQPGPGVPFHDWWCAAVVAGHGRIIYDPRPGVLYRQHGRNVVGMGHSWLSWKLGEVRRFLRSPQAFFRIHTQACELLRLYGDTLTPQDRAMLVRLVESKRSLHSRLAFAATAPITHHDRLGTLVVRGLIALGWY